MHLLLLLLLILLVLRVLYRTVMDFPPWPGDSPLQGRNTAGLLPEAQFWNLVQESRRLSHGNYDEQIEELTELLKGLPLRDIVAFERAFTALMERINHFRYWEAAYALNWGCSDDTFIDFQAWLIGQGRNKFYWICRFPRLLFFFAVKDSVQPYEGLQYCAATAYKELNGRDLPMDDISYGETAGRPFNESFAILKYPELAFLAW